MKHWQRAWSGFSSALDSVARFLALQVIAFYRAFLRAWLGGSCRFTPTCSHYASEAFQRHSFFRATWLVIRRLGRCHPWGPFGVDPVPTSISKRESHEPIA